MKCKYCGKDSVKSFCSLDCEENSNVFNILENITEEIDLVFKATSYPWKVSLTKTSHDILKNKPGTRWHPETREYLPRKLVYQKDGREYLICVENHNIPFIIHARIADKVADFDCLELDDLDRPNVKAEHCADFEAYWASI